MLFLLIPFTASAAGQAEEAAPEFAEGVVEYFDGEVLVDGVPADFGMRVPFGAVVETGADSYCEVVFENKNIFKVMESTIAEIRLSYENPEIVIDKGTFAALFSKLDAFVSDEPFRVKTHAAVASVRGTAFFIKVINPDLTYVCICNGELEFPGVEEEEPLAYSSGHHKAVYFGMADGETEIREAPMLYHTDEDMDLLARHISEKINWYY